MRAIVVREFGPPDVMTVEEVPDPVAAPGQVVIRVGAAGVNPVDTYIRSGTYARTPPLPYTPGMDVGGTVLAAAADVTRVQAGDRVYAYGVAGGYAELVACDASQVVRVPDWVSPQQGAAIGVPYGTAWRALLLRADARPGQSVLVHGASGGVGLAAVQIGRARGLHVIGTAGTDAGEAAVRAAGAHQVLNHRAPGYLDQVLAATGGKGVDVVVEMLANVNLDRDLDVLAFRGRVVIIGNRGRVEIDPRKIMGKDAAVLGMTVFNTPREDMQEIHAGIAAGLANRTLAPVVGRELPLAAAPDAHRLVMEPGAMGKLVLVP